MPKREESLNKYLVQRFGNRKHKKPKYIDFLNSKYHRQIMDIYVMLGGLLREYPTAYRGFDIQCANFIVELDEERHFNRYRNMTLNSELYLNFTKFDVLNYKKYCVEKEARCLKAATLGNNWENESTKKQFGNSDLKGVLGSNGSSRWKQRAFYDYLRDISSYIMNVPIIRISIWEKLENASIDSLIKTNQFDEISTLILERKTS